MNTIVPVIAFSAAMLMSASGIFAQQPQPEAQTITLGLQGYSPVSYLDNNRAEPGSPRFSAEHDGVTYFFVNNQQRQKFIADPQRYLPAYGGHCAYGCSVGGSFQPNPERFKIIDGRVALFIKNDEVDTLKLWEKEDPMKMKAKADAYWAEKYASRAYLGAQNLPAEGVAIGGYSPVSYFTVGRAEKGSPQFRVEHDGAIYYLTSKQQVDAFKANPDRYEPAFGGWCAFGMSVEDKFPIDPSSFKIVKGRLFLFLKNEDVDALKLWNEGNERDLCIKAEAHWKKVSQ